MLNLIQHPLNGNGETYADYDDDDDDDNDDDYDLTPPACGHPLSEL